MTKKTDPYEADTEANVSHYEKVDNLTIGEIMGMDNYHDLFKGKADLIDNLRGYLLDNLAVRKHMNYDWGADEHTTKQSTYEEDKDFADYIDRVRDEVILKYHRNYKESLTSEDCIKAGKPIRAFVHNLESLEDALRPTRKFNTKNNKILWEGFQSELNNENLSYEARETAKDYFAYLAELADREDQKGGE